MWKTWVRNKAKTIQEAFPRSAWRHIPGKENPADLCSRSVLASKLVEPDCIWWSGPKFLHKPQDQWTSATFDNTVMQRPDVQSEAKPPTTIALIALRKPSSPPFFNVKRFGTWETVFRMTARIQRKLANATRARKNKLEHVGELSATELNLAKFYWYRQLQAAAFPGELESLRQNQSVHRTSFARILIARTGSSNWTLGPSCQPTIWLRQTFRFCLVNYQVSKKFLIRD